MQWLYLLKIFERPELYKKFNGPAFKFENVHTKFKVSQEYNNPLHVVAINLIIRNMVFPRKCRFSWI